KITAYQPCLQTSISPSMTPPNVCQLGVHPQRRAPLTPHTLLKQQLDDERRTRGQVATGSAQPSAIAAWLGPGTKPAYCRPASGIIGASGSTNACSSSATSPLLVAA